MFRNNEKLMMFMFLVLFFGISGVGSASAADVPVANFTSNATQGMAPLSVQFNDTSIGNPTSWNWNFGDGINSTLQNPTHAYKTAGTYNVTLTASNSVGSNTLTQNNYIAVIPQIYSSYLGGSSSDQGYSITVGKNGNIYITGRTSSTNFPTTNNAYQTQNGGGYDAFLSEFNSNGSLIYSTYLGGNNTDSGNSVAIDNAGNVYITGSTTSTNFPTTSNAYQTQIAGGENVFLSEFNSSGSIIYSTYLGGSSFDTGKGIALDKNGNIYLTGETSSLNFPITSNAYQTQNVGVGDVFLTEFNSNKTLIYSTYLGGSGLQYGYGVAVDNSGNAYITGYTSSSNFPITSNAYQKSPTGTLNSNHAFISEFDLNGNLIYSSYLGGNGGDYGYGIAVDNSGNTYITGYTTSNNFPITSNAYQKTYIGSNTYDAFLSEFNSFGNLIYSTYLGGSVDIGTGITVDNIGNVYITGYTSSPNFPITNNAYQKTYGGSSYDAFLSEFNSGGNLIYSTFIGGNNLDYGYSVAVDNTGNTYITGYTVSTNFPTTSEAYQTQYAGGTYDGFIVKLKIPAAPITSFTANTISGTAPLNIQFNDTSSNSPTSWLWTFGDGESSTQQNPTYTYNTPGKYTVTLTATNADGNNTITMNNLINVIGPVADNTTGLTYITIGAAVNAANNGDTILVNGGNYIENVILNKNLILEASGQVNIIPLDSTQPVFLINNSGSGSTIQGFTITGSTNSGIYINNATGNTILNNTLLGNNSTSWGICLVNSDGPNNITGNNVTNCIEGINLYNTTGANITYNTAVSNVYDGIALTYSINNTITNNNGITLNISGIRLNNSNNNTVTNNNLTGNIWTSISLLSSQYNEITNNTASNNQEGMYLYSSDNNIINQNTATNNIWDGIAIDTSNNNTIENNNNVFSNNCGIRIIGTSTGNQVLNNTVIGNTWANMSLDTAGNTTITGNTFNNSEEGIFIYNSNDNTLNNNTMNNNTWDGIYIGNNSNNNTITGNTISNGSGYGVRIQSSTSNSVIANDLINNYDQAYDDSNNNWNNTTTGNYYSDWNNTKPRPVDGGTNIDQHPSTTIF